MARPMVKARSPSAPRAVGMSRSMNRRTGKMNGISRSRVHRSRIVFQLGDSGVLRRALEFLRGHRRGPLQAASHRDRGDDDLILGRFGASPVSLIWDDEDFARCVLVFGPQARSTMRVSLYGEDIDPLIQAIEQADEGIPSKD